MSKNNMIMMKMAGVLIMIVITICIAVNVLE